jgi:1-phosphofructokinase
VASIRKCTSTPADRVDAALAAGVDVLKLSDNEIVAAGWAESVELEPIMEALARLQRAGARAVVASRGPEPALALADDRPLELGGPRFSAADPAGAGDAMVAALSVSLARGDELVDALVFGAAAGAINATRHGLGTGSRRQIEQLSRRITVRELANSTLDSTERT